MLTHSAHDGCRPPVVLISQCVDEKLRKSMTRTVERLGGTVTTSSQDFTVFVTLEAARGQKDRGFTKSLKALSALAGGELTAEMLKCMPCGRHKPCA